MWLLTSVAFILNPPQNYLAVWNINITLVYSLLCALLFFVAVLCLHIHISKIWNSVKKKTPMILQNKTPLPLCSRKQIACSWEVSHQEFSRSRYSSSIILMFCYCFQTMYFESESPLTFPILPMLFITLVIRNEV